MSGVYFHIPFCKQACHYCDFHFSTSMKYQGQMLEALKKELYLRRDELHGSAETVYFGGGTPSLLSPLEVLNLVDAVAAQIGLQPDAEITLEANPDDLDPDWLRELARGPVNRLSIGIQSFDEAELRWMNRAHNAGEARRCLELVAPHFDNYSIDLIYGIPGSNPETWEETLGKALEFNPPHISAYALTVEPGTALHTRIAKGKSPDADEERARADFEHLVETLEVAGYEHYEISNFGKADYHSKNNTAYWEGKSYLGIGPSAHSYDGLARRWNVAHNLRYIRSVEAGRPEHESELLSVRDRYNERIMTGLRTRSGISLAAVRDDFGPEYLDYMLRQAMTFKGQGLLEESNGRLRATATGKFLTDGIASDLFMLILE